jgi:hypothetical protein
LGDQWKWIQTEWQEQDMEADAPRQESDDDFGHFSEQHAEAGDNCHAFLKGKACHLLYLWHLSDVEQLLTGMVQVLSKKVAIDTNRVYTKTESCSEEVTFYQR